MSIPCSSLAFKVPHWETWFLFFWLCAFYPRTGTVPCPQRSWRTFSKSSPICRGGQTSTRQCVRTSRAGSPTKATCLSGREYGSSSLLQGRCSEHHTCSLRWCFFMPELLRAWCSSRLVFRFLPQADDVPRRAALPGVPGLLGFLHHLWAGIPGSCHHRCGGSCVVMVMREMSFHIAVFLNASVSLHFSAGLPVSIFRYIQRLSLFINLPFSALRTKVASQKQLSEVFFVLYVGLFNINYI